MKHKKIISFFLLIFIFAGMLSGCGTDNLQLPSDSSNENYQDYEETAQEPFTLEELGKSGYFYYYRDLTTDVLYLRYGKKAGHAGIGGLTVMLDPETGLPLTYTRYMDLYEDLQNGG